MTRWGTLRTPMFGHAARVAAVATLSLGVVYLAVVTAFDLIDAHHLVGQVDANLTARIVEATPKVRAAPVRRDTDSDRDVDSAPVFLWRVQPSGNVVALSDNAPRLPTGAWARLGGSTTTTLGSNSFRLVSARVDGGWLVAGQSLSEPVRVGHVLLAVEGIVGPCLLLATFLGTLVVGIKASGPVEQARRRQLEFTADASHELRTPLSVIEAEVGIALRTKQDAGQSRDTLNRIAREGGRLRRIVEDLLWLARFDSAPPPPSDEPVDLLVIAEGCADRFGVIAHSRKITISAVSEGDGAASISAPPEWIDRLTAVLVDNACRYAGQHGSVRIVVGVHGNKVNLAVEDSGPGIPLDERGHLFDRFHRTTDKGTGAGLGLAIADSVVRLTGGQWHIGDSAAGGARLAVSWHASQARLQGSSVMHRDRSSADSVYHSS